MSLCFAELLRFRRRIFDQLMLHQLPWALVEALRTVVCFYVARGFLELVQFRCAEKSFKLIFIAQVDELWPFP